MKLELPGKSRPYLMAHRGNSEACPENTIASFQRALEDGADIIETDLHLTADGVFVCIHDATVDRTTDGSGAVAQMTLAEIKSLSASYDRPGFAAERVPTLAETMALIPEMCALALELKTDRFLEPEVCLKLVRELEKGGVQDRTVVLSFSLERLQCVRSVAPEIPLGHITLSRPLPTPGVQLVGPLWPLLVLNPFYVWIAHRRGMQICPLDIAPVGRLWYYRLLRCDAVMANNTARLARALKPDRGHEDLS